MSIVASTVRPSVRPRVAGELWHVSREAYRQMAESGAFSGERVELLRGRIVNMAPMGLPHDMSIMKGGRALRRAFPEVAYTIRAQQEFEAVHDTAFEPDLCVVNGPVEAVTDFPDAALLIVEIAESSLAYDRQTKAPLYAESGVADYWIVNIPDKVVEVYRAPQRDASGVWGYAQMTPYKPGEPVAPLAKPDAPIDPTDLLP
jgi:Uma2 family endonuclease